MQKFTHIIKHAIKASALLLLSNLAQAQVVGSLAGEHSVSADGHFQYQIPIQTPPGTKGIVPKLSIHYTGQSQNSVLGIGWALSGLSAIHRCAATFAQDGKSGGIQYTAEDKLCLDGARLIAISGSYGANGTEYRTEQDSFSKIISYGNISGGPAKLKAWTKTGEIIEYGYSNDARIEAQGKAAVAVWAVSKVSDRMGNYYRVSYNENNNTGEYTPARIDYTGNSQQSVNPYNSIRFEYTSRPDNQTHYHSGSLRTASKRLSNIKTYAGNTLVKDYRMQYATVGIMQQSRIVSLQECDGQNQCLPATQIEWQSGSSGALQSKAIHDLSVPNAARQYAFHNADINGDGISDLLWTGNEQNAGLKIYSALGASDGSYQAVQNSSPVAGGNYAQHRANIIDVNSDGMADIVWVQNANALKAQVALSNGDGTFQNAISSNVYSGIQPTQLHIGDYNGDGLVDLGWTRLEILPPPELLPAENKGHRAYIAFNQGNGSFAAAIASVLDSEILEDPNTVYPSRQYASDINQDGNTDLVHLRGQELRVYLADGNGYFQAQALQNISGLNNSNEPIQLVDVNGDGVPDLQRTEITANGIHTLVAFGKGDGSFTAATSNSAINSGDYSKYTKQQFGDYNGDSYIDLMVGRPLSSGVHTILLLGKGDGTFTKIPGQSVAPVSILEPDPTSIAYYFSQPYPTAVVDSNGDGLSDLLWLERHNSDTAPLKIHSAAVQNNGFVHLVTGITDGFGAKTTVEYTPLTDAQVYTKGQSSFPSISIQAPMYVVSAIAADNGIGGTVSTRYRYDDYKIHTQGRGGLGFASMTSIDGQTGIETITHYHQDYPYTGLVERSEQRLPSAYNHQLLQTSSTEYAIKNTIAGNNRIQFVYPSSSTETAYLLNNQYIELARTITRTDNQYDNYGNPTEVQVSISGDGNHYKKTTRNTYHNQQSAWLIGQLIRAEVTSTINGSTDANSLRISAYQYHPTTGLLTHEVIEPDSGDPNIQHTTYYQHDGFGNRINVIQCAGDPNSCNSATPGARTASTQYDSRGQFPISLTNAAGHTESRSYDPQFGTTTTLTGPNGLSTTWTYDSFGRVLTEFRADGTQTSATRSWCNSGCAQIGDASVKYSITTQSSGNAPVTEYFDKLQRKLRSKTIGFNGTAIHVDTEYDARLRVKRSSEPYFANSTALWSVPSYDVLDRQTQLSYPQSNDGSMAQNSFQFQGYSTVAIDANNRQKTEIKNAIGQTITISDAMGNSMDYQYDSQSNLHVTEMRGYPQTRIQIDYDVRGRKIRLDDPDMGIWTYGYNAFGELIQQTDAKNQTISLQYDTLGRMTHRIEPEGTSRWYYDNASGKGIGKLKRLQSASGYYREYQYDNLGRVSQTEYYTDLHTYRTKQTYDNLGRVDTIQYPAAIGHSSVHAATGLQIQRQYNSHGYLEKIQKSDGSTIYWQAETMNARGQLEQHRLGNGVTTTTVYNAANGWVDAIVSSNIANDLAQHLTYTHDVVGNITSRTDHRQGGVIESFSYDALDRLVRTSISNLGPGAALDPSAYLPEKGFGDYEYGTCNAGPHAVCRAGNISYSYDANGNMTYSNTKTIEYTSYNKPTRIQENNTTVNFYYGADRSRVLKTSSNGQHSTRTHYIGLGATGGTLFERESNTTTGTNRNLYFIYANSEQPIAIERIDERYNTVIDTATEYLHRDHTGSVEGITDANGNLLTTKSHNAWGQRRNPDWTDSATQVFNPINGHLCFTGHESIPEVGLIHMNGRVYDPTIGRFLSPDPHIQAPGNTQSYNRYSYVLNNPLKYTDPSGYFFKRLKKRLFSALKSIGRVFAKVAPSVATVALGISGNAWAAGFINSAYGAFNGANGLDLGLSFAASLFGGGVAEGITQGITNGLGAAIARGAVAGALTGGVNALINDTKLSRGILQGAAAGAVTAAVIWGAQRGVSEIVKWSRGRSEKFDTRLASGYGAEDPSAGGSTLDLDKSGMTRLQRRGQQAEIAANQRADDANWKPVKAIFNGGSTTVDTGREIRLEIDSVTLGADGLRFIAEPYPLDTSGNIAPYHGPVEPTFRSAFPGLVQGSTIRNFDAGYNNANGFRWFISIPIQESAHNVSMGHSITIFVRP